MKLKMNLLHMDLSKTIVKVSNSSKTKDENELKMQHSPPGRKIPRVVLNSNIWFAVLWDKQGQRESKEYKH